MIDFSNIIAFYGPKLLLAILILVVGGLAINLILRGIKKAMVRAEVDPNLRPFLFTLTRLLLRIMVVLAALGTMGVEMTSFIAILGSAGLAIGLALSGTLQNFAGGLLILLFKPFKVGDVIKAQGFMGTVKEIQIFNTLILTVDNHEVIIPNGGLATNTTENFSAQEKRKVMWTFGIGYGDSVQQAREVLQEVLATDERILTEEAPFIQVAELGNSSVNLTVRVWVKTDDYWPIFFEMNEKVYNAFNEAGLHIPFPQMDVHLHRN
ncbi:MAG: mechanosensitive ion channel [Saprospiraceae bacterium]|nr:mechanosensitive ion channel [Saprospiraceae bacterium]MCF8248724.1 mechanosensitive ion channel [Saprospiraceae bacterium]MCF8278786.1 mechanosensitive ion channel [Bacteroidales bacterium]MCF8310586.1 mechanosensitive ion channel [Saprospiraceae bacterium]MCF8439145.1 mechanosensitive ion channel [Saprospiraceae bacterium]